MPRAPRIRKREPRASDSVTSATREPISAERRSWLAQWKDRAVSQLPWTASVETKVQLRREVEHALREHEPSDAIPEIADIVTLVVCRVRDQIERAAKDEQRAQQKLAALDLAEIVFEIAIKRCPTHLVGQPHSPQRQQILRSLRPKLRSALTARLAGEESVEHVIREVIEWLSAWQAEQEPEPWSRSTMRKVLKGAKGAAVVFSGAIQVPEVREALKEGAAVIGPRIASLLRRKPANPAPQGTNDAVANH